MRCAADHYAPPSDGQLDSDAAWLDSRASDDVFVELQRHGAIAQAALVAEQLPALLRAAQRHRETSFLLDHCGFSDFSGGDDYPNARALFALASGPNVHVKVSNHVWHLASSVVRGLAQSPAR